MMNIRFINNVEGLGAALDAGEALVECSFGKESDGFLREHSLNFDHHGEFATRPAVAIQAVEWRRKDTTNIREFIVTGAADADATFCIAVLSGALEGSRDRKGNRTISDALIQEMANVIAIFDVDPIGREFSEYGAHGRFLAAWHLLMTNSPRDALSFYKGVALWRDLLSDPKRFESLIQFAVDQEEELDRLAQEDMRNCVRYANAGFGFLGILNSKVFGFNTWYMRDGDEWHNHVVAALTAKGGNITIGCPKIEVAEAMFGPGGLNNVWDLLSREIAPGFGGRETVGGSPRGLQMTEEDVEKVLTVLQEFVVSRFPDED